MPANDVRAMLGILDGSVTKGFVTTTSTFAPEIMDDKVIAAHIPNRLELKAGPELMAWLGELSAKRGAPT